jgi:hypothetical protein
VLDAVKELNEIVFASAGIVNRLGAMVNRLHKGTAKDTNQEKHTNSRKYYVRWRECLKDYI